MNHIAQIRQKLTENDLDALILAGEKNQRYAAGFAFTDGLVIVAREKAWLLTDSRYIEAAEKAAGGCVSVQLFDREHSLTALARAALREAGAQRVGAEEESLPHARYLALEKDLELPLLPAQHILNELRASKTEEELQYMVRAQRISEAALAETLPLIRPGMTEKELAAELVYRMLRHGSEGNAFDPIVVSGPNTSLPHGVPGDRQIREGEFVTMDFGSLCGGYCSDMTRTVAVGFATEEMRQIYDVVLRAQLAGIAAGRAGVTGREIDAAAREVIAQAGFGPFFGHGFGHSLGLDIHERPAANPSGDTPMPAGAVVSAEPGIYLPGRFGVRIEDVMVLREGGSEVITRAPKAELLVL